MKFFDKKSLIIIIFSIITLCIYIYFFNKDESNEYIIDNELYIPEDITETSTEIEEIIVHIDGEVVTPGLVHLPSNSRIADAIAGAGGAKHNYLFRSFRL